MSAEPRPQKIPRLSAKETERIRRTPGRSGHPICGIVIGSSWHEPVACAYPPGHTGDHSWASIPQFNPATRLEEQYQAAYRACERIAELTDGPAYPPALGHAIRLAQAVVSTPASEPKS